MCAQAATLFLLQNLPMQGPCLNRQNGLPSLPAAAFLMQIGSDKLSYTSVIHAWQE